ncbi:interleukin-6 receptor subunit beta [Trichomycterus rosablanca]|uniref:interleukin-6 receptor subunit beta n=1 Tax=Trichomycterus rosablanca TaxID=2290929 RepID=UPI002F3539E3
MLTARVTMSTSLHLVLVLLSVGCAAGFWERCATIVPDSTSQIPVELGKEFTAVCNLVGSKYSADDIEWFSEKYRIPREFYKKLNKSAVAVTFNVTNSMKNPLMCNASKQSLSHEETCRYGIYLDKGYPPSKPENLTCIALQDGKRMSSNLTCSWEPGTRDPLIPTSYTLYAGVLDHSFSVTSSEPLTRRLTVNLGTFPSHMTVNVCVEAKNELQTVTSGKISDDAERFVKPNPPSNVELKWENKFPTSVIVNWTHPIDETVFKLKYNINYCKEGSSVWEEVPYNALNDNVESYRLQFLQPYTKYVVRMRCIHQRGLGFWSEWSPNATAWTPEDVPKSKPDLWRFYEDEDKTTNVKLIWKEPVKSNGKILGYDITINTDGIRSESLLVHSQELKLHLKGGRAFVKITANNSVGVSPRATLMIPKPGRRLPVGVKEVNWSVPNGTLWVSWLKTSNVSEYLIETVSIPEKEMWWQRVAANTLTACLEGDFKPFKRYHISVYPIYRERHYNVIYSLPGKPVTVAAYLQQGPPEMGPVVKVTATGKNSAQLKWEELPVDIQRGFLTNYTIFYKTGDNEQYVVLGPNVFSYNLTKLTACSQYEVHVIASNTEGSANGSKVVFYTKKYEQGEVEVIVVIVCLSFLFFIVFVMMLTIRKRELIKKHFWPQVPDPSHSTIAKWSPDCPSKPDAPKEATLADVSVVEVDVFDGKSLCDDNKSALPLKKDRYLPEENSSGIGGSSCMSTPRQSVSSNDEADSGQTTASTVQYSSVLASGYKGQTPSAQAAMFSRSESTQPLLDCEENPDHLSEAGSPNHTNSYFRRPRGLEQLHTHDAEEPSFGSLTFSPMEEEDTPTLTEDPPIPTPSYMPQKNGYRPQ